MKIWLHVSTLQDHHQAFIMNHFIKKLYTFLESQSIFTNTKQVRVFRHEMVHNEGLMMIL